MKYSWDSPATKWFECVISGSAACQALTFLEHTYKYGQNDNVTDKNKAYGQVQEILHCNQASSITIKFIQQYGN